MFFKEGGCCSTTNENQLKLAREYLVYIYHFLHCGQRGSRDKSSGKLRCPFEILLKTSS